MSLKMKINLTLVQATISYRAVNTLHRDFKNQLIFKHEAQTALFKAPVRTASLTDCGASLCVI